MTLTIVHQDSINLTNLPDQAADIAAGKILGSWWNKNLTYTGTLDATNGGTGVNSGTAANGQILIGNGTGFTLATLTQGANISITNATGSITIVATPGGSSGQLQYNNGGTLSGAAGIIYASSGNNFSITAQNNADTALKVYGTASASNFVVDIGIGSTQLIAVDSVGAIRFAPTADVSVPSTYSFLKNYNTGSLVMGTASGKSMFFNIGLPTYFTLNGSGATVLITAATTTQIGLIIQPKSSATGDNLQMYDAAQNVATVFDKNALLSKYKEVATAGYGLVVIYAKTNLTAQTGTVASVATYTPSATGSFIISGYLNVTAVSLDVIKITVTYQDENNASQTITPLSGIAAIGNNSFITGELRCNNTIITVAATLTTGTGTITYDVGATFMQNA